MTKGTLLAPPIIYTELIWSLVKPALSKAYCNFGSITAKTEDFSNTYLLMLVLRSIPFIKPYIKIPAYLLEDKTSFTSEHLWSNLTHDFWFGLGFNLCLF